jgi:hypothetical protein
MYVSHHVYDLHRSSPYFMYELDTDVNEAYYVWHCMYVSHHVHDLHRSSPYFMYEQDTGQTLEFSMFAFDIV